MEKEFLIKIAEKCEKERVRLVLDECFVQFLTSGEEASMQLETGRFRYLFVLQAFTKIYAVPGIRLGYGISSDKHCWNGWRRYVSRGAYQLRHRLQDSQH